MLRLRTSLVVAGMAAAFVTPCLSRADAPTATTLVYNFTYSADQSITARDSNQNAEAVQSDALAGGTNGISHYGGKLDDKGTMTVQVIGKPQADGGQVVTISEAGENTDGDLRRLWEHERYLRPEQDGLHRGIHAAAFSQLEVRRPQRARQEQALANLASLTDAQRNRRLRDSKQ
jgi:hypothetical protein